MREQTAETLKMILLDPLTNLGHELISVLPNIFGAIAILVAGYFIAKLSSFIIKKVMEKLSIDKLSDKSGITGFLVKIDPKFTLSLVLSKLIYYIIIITFIMSAAEALNMEIMAEALKSILLYLPNVIASIFVLMFGFILANTAKTIVSKSALEMNIDFADTLGKMIYFIIAIISVSLSISQLNIETGLLNQVASIILIAIGVALALSLGLGTKELSGLIISGNYIRDIYNTGDYIILGDIEGKIISIGTTKTIIKTEDNEEVSISNDTMLKSNIVKR